jgi:hypothetical protein
VGLDALMGVLGAGGKQRIIGLCPRSPLRHTAPNGPSSPPALGPFIFGVQQVNEGIPAKWAISTT